MQKMRQGEQFQTCFYFLKKNFNEVKANSLELNFNIFR